MRALYSFVLLLVLSVPAFSQQKSSSEQFANQKGIEWFEFTPALLMGGEIVVGFDDLPWAAVTGIVLEPTLFFTPQFGYSLNLAYHFSTKFEPIWFEGHRTGINVYPQHELLGGMGFKTRRIGRRTGAVIPFNTLIQGGAAAWKVEQHSYNIVEFHAKIFFESGFEKRDPEGFNYNLLFYVGGHMFNDGWPIPFPSFGVKFEPVFSSLRNE